MRVIITGATGLIGKEITRLCHLRGLGVNYLTTSRSKIKKEPDYRGFYWNPATGEIDTACFSEVGAIINLAGENVFQRWTKAGKARILNSRLQSAESLYKSLKGLDHQVDHLISSSAIGYYPSSYQKMYYEDQQESDSGFLGKVVVAWENANEKLSELGIKVAKVRTGLVLAYEEGALPKMQMPFKLNVGSPLGNGNQWQSWIHITDVARIYIHILENGLTGVYNAVAPNPLRNHQIMEEVGASMGKKMWMPKVPPLALKIVMGEMSDMVLSSQLVASKKIEDSGFTFLYTSLSKALADLETK